MFRFPLHKEVVSQNDVVYGVVRSSIESLFICQNIFFHRENCLNISHRTGHTQVNNVGLFRLKSHSKKTLNHFFIRFLLKYNK